MRARISAAIVLAAVLAACQFSENRYAKRAIRSDELPGTWRATDFAIKSLRDVGHTEHLDKADHEIILRADGTCSIKTVFNAPLAFSNDPEYHVYEAGCHWHLGNVGHQALELDLTPTPKTGATYFYFADEQGQVIIWQYATDPDAWRYLEFERTKLGA
jgi:hypothetical protein